MREGLDWLVVDLGQQSFGEDLGGPAVRCDATGAQKRDPVRVGRGKPQVVHHHDHRVTGVRPWPAQSQHQFLVPEIERRGRFVEQEERGVTEARTSATGTG